MSAAPIGSRVRVLTEIASRYPELIDPLFGPGTGDGGVSVQLMPTTYTTTVREFERLLAQMRHNSDQQGKYGGYRLKTLAFHLEGWHTTAERIICLRPVLKENRKGKLVQLRDHHGNTVTRPTISYRRHPDAKQDRADLAIRWIAEHWPKTMHEPFMPRELSEELQVAA